MDVVISGRHQNVSDHFRTHVAERMAKVEQLAPRALRTEVLVSHEPNRSKTKASERVEITCHIRGPVVRAEATHDDKYAAFELAMDKLVERLRRSNERRRVARTKAHKGDPAAVPVSAPIDQAEPDAPQEAADPFGDSPIEVREKVHQSTPMTLSQALAEMELVGHDFFLFHDSDTDKPSVVYRRRGWAYGVIHLDVDSASIEAVS
jgi:ribosomal subunit interface protein